MPEVPKLSTLAVVLHIAGNPPERSYASAIMSATGFPSGTVVPIVTRMADRDGLLVKSEAKVPTGRPRIQYEPTACGWAEAHRLVALVQPVVAALPSDDDAVCHRDVVQVKANSSSLWIFSAAHSGSIVGSSSALAPLTHQAAYVELRRLTAANLLAEQEGRFVITEAGSVFAAQLRRDWEPVVTRAAAGIAERGAL